MAAPQPTLACETPWVTSLLGVAIFAGFGALTADMADFSRLLAVLIGAVYGAVLGWGFSLDNHRSSPRGVTRILYGGSILVGIVGLIAFKVVT